MCNVSVSNLSVKEPADCNEVIRFSNLFAVIFIYKRKGWQPILPVFETDEIMW